MPHGFGIIRGLRLLLFSIADFHVIELYAGTASIASIAGFVLQVPKYTIRNYQRSKTELVEIHFIGKVGVKKSPTCCEEVGRSMPGCCSRYAFGCIVNFGVNGSHASEERSEQVSCAFPGMLIDVLYLGIEKLWLASLASGFPFNQPGSPTGLRQGIRGTLHRVIYT